MEDKATLELLEKLNSLDIKELDEEVAKMQVTYEQWSKLMGQKGYWSVGLSEVLLEYREALQGKRNIGFEEFKRLAKEYGMRRIEVPRNATEKKLAEQSQLLEEKLEPEKKIERYKANIAYFMSCLEDETLDKEEYDEYQEKIKDCKASIKRCEDFQNVRNGKNTTEKMSVNSLNLEDLDDILGNLINDEEYMYFVHGTDTGDEQYGDYSENFDRENEEYRRIIEEKLSCIFEEGLYARDSKIDITAIELGKGQDNSKKIKQLKNYIENGYEYKTKNTLILLEIPKKCFSDKIADFMPLFEYDKEGKGVSGITGAGMTEHYRIPKEYIKCAVFKNGRDDIYICENEFYDKNKIVEKGIINGNIGIDTNSSLEDIKRYIELCEGSFDATGSYEYLRTEVSYIKDILFDKMGEIDLKEYDEIYSNLERLYKKSKSPLDLQRDKIEKTDFTQLTDLEVREVLKEFYSISSTELQIDDGTPLYSRDAYGTYKECLALLSEKGISNKEDKDLLNIKINNTKKYAQMLEITPDIDYKMQLGEELTESEKKTVEEFYKLLDNIGKEDENSLDTTKIADIRKQMEWFYKGQTMLTVQDINEYCTQYGLDFNYEMGQARDRVELRTKLDQSDLTSSDKESSLMMELSSKAESLGLDIGTEIEESTQRNILRKEMRSFAEGKSEMSIDEINNRCNSLGLNFNYEMENAKTLPIGSDPKNSVKKIATGALARDVRTGSSEIKNNYNELENPTQTKDIRIQ